LLCILLNSNIIPEVRLYFKQKNMRKNIAILTMMVVFVTLFAGCNNAANPANPATNSASKDGSSNTNTPSQIAAQDLMDLAEAQQKIATTYDENDPAAVAKVMETYAEYGAKSDLRDFESAESFDAPSGFPSGLIYGKGKITQSSDDGDESYINKSITIKTTEDVKVVRDFYKNLLSQAPWKITSQSSESGGASYEAVDSANIQATVDIAVDQYSKIVSVNIYYSGSVES
jgi:hypothetical protein